MRKLHSLSGVVPIGAFVLLHIWTSLSIAGSTQVYDRQVTFLHDGPLFGFLEAILVLLPLAFHGLYGVVRSFEPREPHVGYDSKLLMTLQRVAGIVVLVFVALHTWELRGETWSAGTPPSAYSTLLVAHLSSTRWGIPWIAFGYLVGLAATFFHLVLGMQSFVTTWGYAKTPAAQRRSRIFFRAVGSFFFALSALLVLQIATGVRYFPSESQAPPALCGSAVPAAPTSSASAAPMSTIPALPGADH